MRKAGIYADIDIDTYHADEGVSSSGITLILDCPKRYWGEYIAKPEISETEVKKQHEKYKLGSALHMYVLEPIKFNNTYYVMTEDVNLTTKAGKEAYALAEQEANGRYVIRAADWREIKKMADSVNAHPVWSTVKGGRVENSVYWDHDIFKVRMRARPDIFTENLIIDIKTTDSIKMFANSIAQYGYHRQAAMQIDGLKAIDGRERHFAYFVVEKRNPYLTACFTLDEASLEQGRREYLDAAAIYMECLEKNEWPGYEDKFQLISLPKWAMKEPLAA